MGRYADIEAILGEEALVPVTWRTASTGAPPPPSSLNPHHPCASSACADRIAVQCSIRVRVRVAI